MSAPRLNLDVVFVSGPAGSGRRETGIAVCRSAARGPWVLDAFGFELRERCHAAHKLFDRRTGAPARHDYFRDQLGVPLACFEGLSPETAYRKFERWARDVGGESCLGNWLERRVRLYVALQEKLPPDQRARSLVIADAEQAEDCRPVMRAVGIDRCTLLLVDRAGAPIPSKQLELPGVRTVCVLNPGDTLSGLENEVRRAAPFLFIETATELPKP